VCASRGVLHISGEGGTPLYTPLLAGVGAAGGVGGEAACGLQTIYRVKKPPPSKAP
jgi:hypothetical protein